MSFWMITALLCAGHRQVYSGISVSPWDLEWAGPRLPTIRDLPKFCYPFPITNRWFSVLRLAAEVH